MYEDFYEDLSQEEQTNLEILLEEFKSKTKDILTSDVNSEWNTIKKENERLIEQNQKLSEDKNDEYVFEIDNLTVHNTCRGQKNCRIRRNF